VPGKVIRVYRKPRAKWAIRAVVGAGIGAVVGVILPARPENALATKARMCPAGPGLSVVLELEPASAA
jgi:hypothetical protein